ncbi:MbnP family copper-binding protein [Piscinibacter sakaiensis]|nr:MbnP family copper-binding protein [Piscinibacter sakaiensis]
MNRNPSPIMAAGAAALALALAGCSIPTSAPGAGAAAGTQPVAVRFAAQVNGQPFACGQSYAGVGTTRSTITPSDYRFYVSEVALVDETGRSVPVSLAQDGVWQIDNIALLDFENGSGPCRNGTSGVNTEVRGTVPAGRYVGLRFTLGVPFARNHGDPTVAPSPLNLTAMFWSWQGGYKFVKFDTASSGQPSTVSAPDPRGAGNASGFSVHLGSTMCAAPSRTEAPKAECANPNRVAVAFEQFDPAKQTVVADIGAVLAGANVDVNAPGTSPGCMSFPGDADCPPVMGALGLAYGGAAARGPQRLFSAR